MKFKIDVCYMPIVSSVEEEKFKHDIYTMDLDLITSSRQITGIIESIIANSMLYKTNTVIESVAVFCPTKEITETLNGYYAPAHGINVSIYCIGP